MTCIGTRRASGNAGAGARRPTTREGWREGMRGEDRRGGPRRAMGSGVLVRRLFRLVGLVLDLLLEIGLLDGLGDLLERRFLRAAAPLGGRRRLRGRRLARIGAAL